MTYTPAPHDIINRRVLEPRDGFTLTAYEVADDDASPIGEELENGGCYTREDIEAWRNGEWHYAGVIVVASRAGVDLGSGAIWGCETGDYWDRGEGTYTELLDDQWSTHVDTGEPVNMWAHDYGEGLVMEALDEARATLVMLGVSE